MPVHLSSSRTGLPTRGCFELAIAQGGSDRYEDGVEPVVLLAFYCLLILSASLVGGLIPTLVRLTHTRMQVATSFVAGLMLGVGILHLLPHAFFQLGSVDRTVAWLLGGFLVMYLIQRFFHFHHHDVPEDAPEGREPCCDHKHAHSPHLSTARASHDHTLAEKSARHLSWSGAALGLTLHTLIDGIALAASVQAEALHPGGGVLLGLGTFLVIILHKPFDALAIATLMAAGGWSTRWRHAVNAAFALMIPVGVVLFYLGAGAMAEEGGPYLGAALAFAAGTFICIAASDLLPELQFHAHDRLKLSVSLLSGILLAILIGWFEAAGHDHHHHDDHPLRPSVAHDHDHDH
jgi:zinc and cadmium transporter